MGYVCLEGVFKPKFLKKWLNQKPIRFLSNYERQAFKFLEKHPAIISLGSETVIIPYRCPFDKNKVRKYMVDLELHFSDGKKILVEIKPDKQGVDRKDPRKRKNIPTDMNSKKGISYLNAIRTYDINSAKWDSAKDFCKKCGYDDFQIWGEKAFSKIGIVL